METLVVLESLGSPCLILFTPMIRQCSVLSLAGNELKNIFFGSYLFGIRIGRGGDMLRVFNIYTMMDKIVAV